MTTDTLLLGATFFALGYAATHKNCVMADRGEVLCPDFVGSLKGCQWNPDTSYSGLSAALREDLLSRRLLDETGSVHVLPLSSVMAQYALNGSVSLLLRSRPVRMIPESGGFRVTFSGINGLFDVWTKRILDTNALPFFGKGSFVRRGFAALLLGEEGEFSENSAPGWRAYRSHFGETYLHVFLEGEEDYPAARRYVSDRFTANRKKAVLASFANEFLYEFRQPVWEVRQSGYCYAPSASYETFLDAYEGGIQCSAGE